MTDDAKPETPEVGPVDDIGLQRAAAIVAAAASDPIRLAQQYQEWQAAVKGTHALLHALIKQEIGVGKEIVVPRQSLHLIDLEEELIVNMDAEQNAHVIVRLKNRSERRAAEKAARRH